jgi:uncharacterized protein
MHFRLATTAFTQLQRYYPIVAVTGPRQSGKTTFVRSQCLDKPYANLEEPDTREFASTDPRGFLAQFPDGAVLDEVQRAPSLFSYLQAEVDRVMRQRRHENQRKRCHFKRATFSLACNSLR